MGISSSKSSIEEQPYSRQETVEIISKRTIGKLIVKHCGNEGQADDPTLVVTLRRILQATITKLDTESEETWRNAEIVIYDQEGNDFCIRSGDFENKFVVQLDEKDEINITCTDRKKKSYLPCFPFSSKQSDSSNSSSSSAKKAAIEQGPTTDSAGSEESQGS
ncbi:uncharacterized protein LOC114537792 [Dendronephthya gigantea]|uniref:uncharacterized protein LOC114537792 n=1 Tax=Dendronephthya gigantea TaxID=151771 RepID=UPI00106B539F|nr:uncharacterized protein LOC114537792 [Dendronephthya gigantea]